jgi:hypothetical protein
MGKMQIPDSAGDIQRPGTSRIATYALVGRPIRENFQTEEICSFSFTVLYVGH